MNTSLKDLEVLEKYLSQDELKAIAKEVAYKAFESAIGTSNALHRTSNLEHYLKRGALEAVKDHIKDFDKDKLVVQLQEKTLKLIESLNKYDLPNIYKDIAEKHIQNNSHIIINKMNEHITSFVNNEKEFSYNGAYNTFSEYIGQQMTDIIYSLFKEHFKKES
jgi:uncharacterized protein (UPF0264 family)